MFLLLLLLLLLSLLFLFMKDEENFSALDRF